MDWFNDVLQIRLCEPAVNSLIDHHCRPYPAVAEAIDPLERRTSILRGLTEPDAQDTLKSAKQIRGTIGDTGLSQADPDDLSAARRHMEVGIVREHADDIGFGHLQ